MTGTTLSILVLDPDNEQYASDPEYGTQLLRDIEETLGSEVKVTEKNVDAGVGFSLSAHIFEIFIFLVAVFDGPRIIIEGTSWYLAKIKKLLSLLRKREVHFSIDASTAALLAAQEINSITKVSTITIERIDKSYVRVNGAFGAEVIDLSGLGNSEASRIIDSDEVGSATKVYVRYIVSVIATEDGDHFTVVVERNGEVSFVQGFGSGVNTS